MHAWRVLSLGQSYNPDFAQPVAVSGDLAGYARRGAGPSREFSSPHRTPGHLLSAGTWNTFSIHRGKFGWQQTQSLTASSNIFMFDGGGPTFPKRSLPQPCRFSGTGRMAQMAGARRVKFTGDSVLTIAIPVFRCYGLRCQQRDCVFAAYHRAQLHQNLQLRPTDDDDRVLLEYSIHISDGLLV
jgi:hypothetical protein